MVDAVTEARQVIRVIVEDPKLPRHIRDRASSLSAALSSNPGLVWDRLEDLRKQSIRDLALHLPSVDYARCVSVPVFWRHHLRQAQQEIFRAPDSYQRYLESLVNPVETIRQNLRAAEPLVPAAHSWLVPVSRISGLDGMRTKRFLRIDAAPPYIVMVFPERKMVANGVKIREPRGVDVIPARHIQWSSGDVPDERIDQDIPTRALGSIEWRP